RQPRQVTLHVGDEHGDAGRGELFGDELQRASLAGAGCPGDEAVTIEHPQRHPDQRFGVYLPTAHRCADRDCSVGGEGLANFGEKGLGHGGAWQAGRTTAEPAVRIEVIRLTTPAPRWIRTSRRTNRWSHSSGR